MILPALLALAFSPASAAVDVTFAVDPRVELVSEALRSAKHVPARTAYEKEADRAFAGSAGDPEAARLAALADADPHGGEALRRALAGDPEIEDLYRRSGFAAFAEAHRRWYRTLEAGAGKDSALDESPASLADYLGSPLAGRHLFVLAPLLPDQYETNYATTGVAGPQWVWVHAWERDGGRRKDFMFHGFGNSVAHELAHTVINPLVLSRPPLPGRPPKGCNDNAGAADWTGCAIEHVVYAVTLRASVREKALRPRGREARYRRLLNDYTRRGFPLLPALCERLKEYETHRKEYPTLESFYPRLEAVFADASKEKKLP